MNNTKNLYINFLRESMKKEQKSSNKIFIKDFCFYKYFPVLVCENYNKVIFIVIESKALSEKSYFIHPCYVLNEKDGLSLLSFSESLFNEMLKAKLLHEKPKLAHIYADFF